MKNIRDRFFPSETEDIEKYDNFRKRDVSDLKVAKCFKVLLIGSKAHERIPSHSGNTPNYPPPTRKKS